MSAPSHGIKCQSENCPAEIMGAESERDLFHAAETFGFEKIGGVWLCPGCKPQGNATSDPARLAVVKPDGLSGKSRPNLDPTDR